MTITFQFKWEVKHARDSKFMFNYIKFYLHAFAICYTFFYLPVFFFL